MGRRRRWWAGGLATLLLLLLIAFLRAPRSAGEPTATVVGPTGQAPALPLIPPPTGLRERAGRTPERLPGSEDHRELAPPADGGRPARRTLRGHLLLDPCEEPLPGDGLEPPEGFAVAVVGAARVAYTPDWLDRRGARSLAATVDTALTEAAELMGTAPRKDLLVVTWPDRESMTEAKEGVTWAQAMYDGAVHLPIEANERSLRHEVLHAQLHATAPCVPYWLDEGLAAYFEGEPGNRAYTWRRMIRTPLWIPFDSLAEPLREDEGADVMEEGEVDLLYAQSLAMTTMLVETNGPGALERALAASNTGTSRHHLWAQVAPGVDGSDMIEFLARRLDDEE